ncbi:ATP-binding protein [Sphingobium sp. KCTC 72723]|uniref:sensor histidine kinase n=1 Tax=Sphingobium sp. KCTC 72723 TaxID=2733867 RepID=UPI00165DACC6|nr:ATP-binding protein [Sphingobium sp. KCTC 72723]
MKGRLLRWVHSIHAHMLAMALGVIITLTAFSLSILFLIHPSEKTPVSVYEVARLMRGQPILRDAPVLRIRDSADAPRAMSHASERLLAGMLADRLGLPRSDVRLYLNRGDQQRYDQFTREIALYGRDGQVDPFIVGTFTAAAKQPSGQWRMVTRSARAPGTIWNLTGQDTLLFGLLFIIPLSMWFSARLTRPIRSFAASVEQLDAGAEARPVPVKGPTEIRMAAVSLNAMQARIAQFVQERTSVVGAIAHDLRTPLSRLHFHLAAAPDPIRSAAQEEIRQMEQLISTTLDFVDNESRPRVMEPLDLGLLVEGLVDDFADMGRDVAIADAAPITIHGDMILLRRLFTNLIDNAVKYGDAARVAVRTEGAMAVVDVADNGPGMAADQLARAFEPFFRGEPSRNRRTGGVGLGLSIVQSAAHAHGGHVTLAARAEGGLCACIFLPLPA